MADVFITATDWDTGGNELANQVITAYQRNALFALRDELIFDQFARVRPGNLTNPGTPVRFLFWNDMAKALTPLNEVTDVEVVGVSDSFREVTPLEYGNAIATTVRIRTDDYLVGFDSDLANLLSWNLVDTIDTLARTELDNATNTATIDGGLESALTAADVITAAYIRQKHAALRRSNVLPWDGGYYMCVISPEVAYDLKVETGEGGWLYPAAYVDTQRIYNNEIGTFAGFRFVESNRGYLGVDAGNLAVDTFATYFLGQDALAKAESIPAHMVMGPVTDRLMRIQPLGWHTYVGWKILREASVHRVITASSIGNNA